MGYDLTQVQDGIKEIISILFICQKSWPLWYIADGMSPENIYEGVKAVRPFGVDSCTNTNATTQDGNPIRFKKDFGKVKKFVEEAQRAVWHWGI